MCRRQEGEKEGSQRESTISQTETAICVGVEKVGGVLEGWQRHWLSYQSSKLNKKPLQSDGEAWSDPVLLNPIEGTAML